MPHDPERPAARPRRNTPHRNTTTGPRDQGAVWAQEFGRLYHKHTVACRERANSASFQRGTSEGRCETPWQCSGRPASSCPRARRPAPRQAPFLRPVAQPGYRYHSDHRDHRDHRDQGYPPGCPMGHGHRPAPPPGPWRGRKRQRSRACTWCRWWWAWWA